jgi:hypothetical protein
MWSQSPLQSLALALLERVLGKYVKGLDADSLQVAILSGQIVLRALELKREALFELGLPVNIEAGFIGRVEITLPWTRLGSEPIRVVISQVQLVATPIDPAQWDEGSRETWRWARKQSEVETLSALHAAMRAHAQAAAPAAPAEGAAEPAGSSSSSSLMSKMLANLELTLEGVHIRYEDSSASFVPPDSATATASAASAASAAPAPPDSSAPPAAPAAEKKTRGESEGSACAAGVLIERIRVFSADASWAAAFSSVSAEHCLLPAARCSLPLCAHTTCANYDLIVTKLPGPEPAAQARVARGAAALFEAGTRALAADWTEPPDRRRCTGLWPCFLASRGRLRGPGC